MRHMRGFERTIPWNDVDSMPVATLLVDFRMLEIERYMVVRCPRIHLRLYYVIMRALGLDEAQLVTLFPLSLSGTPQRWYASLESSRRRTCRDLTHEFLRQYSFSIGANITSRELKTLKQRSDEFVSSCISYWRENSSQVIDRHIERDRIYMFFMSL